MGGIRRALPPPKPSICFLKENPGGRASNLRFHHQLIVLILVYRFQAEILLTAHRLLKLFKLIFKIARCCACQFHACANRLKKNNEVICFASFVKHAIFQNRYFVLHQHDKNTPNMSTRWHACMSSCSHASMSSCEMRA